MEEKQLNIYQKLQKCRVEVQNAGIKKSGENKFSNYDYFELSDFLPAINVSMNEQQLTSIFLFETEKASLQIINSENPQEKLEFKTPVSITPLKGCNNMQNIGAAQSYARRYLYFMAFEIAESDTLDSGDKPVDEEKMFNMKKIDPVKIDTVKSLLKKTHSNEKTFLQYFKLKRVEDITNEKFNSVMNTLQKKSEQLEKNKAKLEKAKQQKNSQEKMPDLGI